MLEINICFPTNFNHFGRIPPNLHPSNTTAVTNGINPPASFPAAAINMTPARCARSMATFFGGILFPQKNRCFTRLDASKFRATLTFLRHLFSHKVQWILLSLRTLPRTNPPLKLWNPSTSRSFLPKKPHTPKIHRMPPHPHPHSRGWSTTTPRIAGDFSSKGHCLMTWWFTGAWGRWLIRTSWYGRYSWYG